MAYIERVRDTVSGPIGPEVIEKRTASGWRMVAIEWRRELPDGEASSEAAFDEEIPYGLRISDDCSRLEVDVTEHRVMTEMMELLAQDFSYSSIVSSLNEKGYRMRNGQPWNRVAIFKMMPRLIEVGPNLFRSEEWELKRRRLDHA